LTGSSKRPLLNYVLEGAGPPVVLIHGVGADLGSWDEVAKRLRERWSLLRMDLRGHGRSPLIREEWSIEKFASDIVDTMDAVGWSQAHVVGFSLGGLIAQSIALDHPDRVDRLAILSAVANRTPEERSKVTGRLAEIRKGGIAAIASASRDRWFTAEFAAANPDRIEARMRELCANDLESYLEAYRIFGQTELGPRLGAIRHRTLVLTGENDVGSNTRMARDMHAAIEGSELVILPRLKHSILVEAPDLVAAELDRFLGAT
jgi:pimeloyl-ACP methyl ester carboxylesterase